MFKWQHHKSHKIYHKNQLIKKFWPGLHQQSHHRENTKHQRHQQHKDSSSPIEVYWIDRHIEFIYDY